MGKRGGLLAVAVAVAAALVALWVLREEGPAPGAPEGSRTEPSPAPAPALATSPPADGPSAPDSRAPSGRPEAARADVPSGALQVRVTLGGFVPAAGQATVTVRDASGRERSGANDAEGTVSFRGLSPGEATYHAQAPGYVASEPERATVGPEGGLVALDLERGVPVEGVVVEATSGRPIAGATVDVHDGGTLADSSSSSGGRWSYGEVRTAADGTFRTREVALRRIVTVTAVAPGYRRGEHALRLDPRAAPPPVRLALEPGGSVVGVVLSPDGAPFAGAQVVVFAPGERPSRWARDDRASRTWARSGPDGRFAVHGLALDAVGEWCASASPPEGAEIAPSEDACGLRPTAREPRREVVLRLRARGGVRFAVTAEGGLVTGLRTTVSGSGLSPDEDPPAPPSAPAAGSTVLAFAGTPGPHEVTVASAGHVPARVAFEIEEGRWLDREVRLPRGVAIAGRVEDEGGRPVSGARVHAHSEDGEPTDVPSDSEGRFVLDGLAPRIHRLRVSGVGPSDSVEVSAPATGVRLVVSRQASVEIRFRIPDGSPRPARASHWAFGDGTSTARFEPVFAGVGRWDLDAGTWRLSVEAEGFAPWSHEVTVGWGDVVVLDAVTLDPGVAVEGTVVDADGRPVAGADLRPEPGHEAASGADGRFRLVHLERQRMRIRAVAAGFFPETLEVDATRTPPPLAFVLHREGRLAGRVLGPDGSPRAGLVVRSTPSKPAKAAGSVAETPSDAEGRYAVRVTPGENRVEVVDPATGRTVHEQEVDADDRETTLDLPVE